MAIDPGRLSRGAIDFSGDPGLTDPSQAEACDVNYIMKRALISGVLPGTDSQAMFGDFSNSTSYHDAQNLILQANEQFSCLSADVRKRFNNDPAAFLDFCDDPSNSAEMVKLGLAVPKPVAPPVVAPGASSSVSPPSPAAPASSPAPAAGASASS